MTQRSLTDDFPLRSGLARRHPGDIDNDELLREVDQELDRRRAAYPALVTRGTLSREEAEQHIATWATIRDDWRRLEHRLERLLGSRADGTALTLRRAPAAYAGTWDARVRELRRELAIRRAAYPKWIANAGNPLTADDAALRLERLDAVHWRYWMQLFGFTPDAPPTSGAGSPAAALQRDLARHAHVAAREQALAFAAGDDAADQDWRTTGRLVAVLAAGGDHSVLAPAELRALAGRTTERLERLLWRRPADAADRDAIDATVARTAPVSAWLEGLSTRVGGTYRPWFPEQKAAA